jgi:hypothetical protein
VPKFIRNPLGSFGLSADWSDTVVQSYQNNLSGAVRAVGDVVVLLAPTSATAYWAPIVDSTITANDKRVIGVIGEKPAETGPDQPGGFAVAGTASTSGATFAAGAEVFIVVEGPARINIGANVVAALDTLTTFTTAGQAATNALAPAANAGIGSLIAIASEASTAKDANNTIRAYIKKM